MVKIPLAHAEVTDISHTPFSPHTAVSRIRNTTGKHNAPKTEMIAAGTVQRKNSFVGDSLLNSSVFNKRDYSQAVTYVNPLGLHASFTYRITALRSSGL